MMISLRSIVDLKVTPDVLDWNIFRSIAKEWNILINSMGRSDVLITMIITIIMLSILYSLSTFYNTIPHPKYTFIIMAAVCISIVLISGYIKGGFPFDSKVTDEHKYYGRELKNPYPTDSIFKHLYTLDETKDICPYGCNQATPPYKECGDTRSLFSFTGALDPGPYEDWSGVDAEGKSMVEGENISKWIHYGAYMCPPKKKPNRWPYSNLCNVNQVRCTSNEIYNTTSYKDKADKVCSDYYRNHGKCISYATPLPTASPSKSEILRRNRINELRFRSGHTPNSGIVNTQCTLSIPTEDIDECPFPQNIVRLDGVDEFKQRQNVNVWKNLYDTITGPTPKRTLSKADEVSWENKERYEIINQNYMPDKFFIAIFSM